MGLLDGIDPKAALVGSFKGLEEPLNATTLGAGERCRRTVCPIEIEKAHARLGTASSFSSAARTPGEYYAR